jgi:hypothetical protein
MSIGASLIPTDTAHKVACIPVEWLLQTRSTRKAILDASAMVAIEYPMVQRASETR